MKQSFRMPRWGIALLLGCTIFFRVPGAEPTASARKIKPMVATADEIAIRKIIQDVVAA